MKDATLIIHDYKGRACAEMEITEIHDDVTDLDLRSNYNKHIGLFMRHLGPKAHVAEVVWKP